MLYTSTLCIHTVFLSSLKIFPSLSSCMLYTSTLCMYIQYDMQYVLRDRAAACVGRLLYMYPSHQVKQFLEDTKRYLTQMLRTINIKEEVHVLYMNNHVHSAPQLERKKEKNREERKKNHTL